MISPKNLGEFPEAASLSTQITKFGFYTERHTPLRIHTLRSACSTPYCRLKINDSKGEYAITYDAVYRLVISIASGSRITSLSRIRAMVVLERIITGVRYFSAKLKDS